MKLTGRNAIVTIDKGLALAGGMGLVGSPLGGALADRIGRRRTLILGLAGSAVWFVAYGSISSLTGLAFLTLAGVSGDLWPTATNAAIVDLVEPELRAEAFGLQRQANWRAYSVRNRSVGVSTERRWFSLERAAHCCCSSPIPGSPLLSPSIPRA